MNGVGRNTPAEPVFGSICVRAGSNLVVWVLMFIEKSTPIRSYHDLGQRHDPDFDRDGQVLQPAERFQQVVDLLDHVGRLVHHQGAADVEELELAGAAHVVPRVRPDHAR